MITNITILSNGKIAPNKTIPLGHKYDNALDSLQFDIPVLYQGYHYYLAFYMKKHDTILLPVNYVDGHLQFLITSTVTRNPGQYEIVFLATRKAVVDGDIDHAEKVFVSTTMYGVVEDNFLQDPVIDDQLDPNLQIIYEDLLRLKDEIEEDLETDYYRGAAYIPDVSEDGVLSFTRDDGKDISIPEPRNLTGPTGPYYKPIINDDGIMNFEVQASTPNSEPAEAKPVDVKAMVKEVSDQYLEGNLEGIAVDYLDDHLADAVNTAVDAKFKFTWDPVNQILYITTEDYEENVEDTEGE